MDPCRLAELGTNHALVLHPMRGPGPAGETGRSYRAPTAWSWKSAIGTRCLGRMYAPVECEETREYASGCFSSPGRERRQRTQQASPMHPARAVTHPSAAFAAARRQAQCATAWGCAAHSNDVARQGSTTPCCGARSSGVRRCLGDAVCQSLSSAGVVMPTHKEHRGPA